MSAFKKKFDFRTWALLGLTLAVTSVPCFSHASANLCKIAVSGEEAIITDLADYFISVTSAGSSADLAPGQKEFKNKLKEMSAALGADLSARVAKRVEERRSLTQSEKEERQQTVNSQRELLEWLSREKTHLPGTPAQDIIDHAPNFSLTAFGGPFAYGLERSNRELFKIAIGGSPHLSLMQVSSDGKFAYLRSDQAIVKRELSTGNEETHDFRSTLVNENFSIGALSNDSRYLFVATQTGGFMAIRLKDMKVEAFRPTLLTEPGKIFVSPSGNFAALTITNKFPLKVPSSRIINLKRGTLFDIPMADFPGVSVPEVREIRFDEINERAILIYASMHVIEVSLADGKLLPDRGIPKTLASRLSPDGSQLVSLSGEYKQGVGVTPILTVFDFRTSQVVRSIPIQLLNRWPKIATMHNSPKAAVLTTRYDKDLQREIVQVLIIDYATGKTVLEREIKETLEKNIVFSPDDQSLFGIRTNSRELIELY